MRYFTKKLADELNSENQSVMEKAEDQWERNLICYENRLEKVRYLLPKKLVNLDLHDSNFIEMKMKRDSSNNLRIELTVQNGSKKLILIYIGVRKVILKYDHMNQLNNNFCIRGIGDWFVDEISRLKDKFIKHEIMFDSGTVLLFEFSSFDIEHI